MQHLGRYGDAKTAAKMYDVATTLLYDTPAEDLNLPEEPWDGSLELPETLLKLIKDVYGEVRLPHEEGGGGGGARSFVQQQLSNPASNSPDDVRCRRARVQRGSSCCVVVVLRSCLSSQEDVLQGYTKDPAAQHDPVNNLPLRAAAPAGATETDPATIQDDPVCRSTRQQHVQQRQTRASTTGHVHENAPAGVEAAQLQLPHKTTTGPHLLHQAGTSHLLRDDAATTGQSPAAHHDGPRQGLFFGEEGCYQSSSPMTPAMRMKTIEALLQSTVDAAGTGPQGTAADAAAGGRWAAAATARSRELIRRLLVDCLQSGQQPLEVSSSSSCTSRLFPLLNVQLDGRFCARFTLTLTSSRDA